MLLKGITCFSVCSSTIHTKNKRKMLVSGKTAVYVALSVSRLYICSFKNPLRTSTVFISLSNQRRYLSSWDSGVLAFAFQCFGGGGSKGAHYKSPAFCHAAFTVHIRAHRWALARC